MKGLILTISLFMILPTAHAIKVGRVNIQRVIMNVEEGKRLLGDLKKDFQKKQKEIKKEETAILKMQESFKKQSMVMNAKKKAEKREEIQKRMLAHQQTGMRYQKEIQEKEQNLQKPILEKVRIIVDSISEKEKYDMVFEARVSPVYMKEKNDITDGVIEAYNKKHK